MNGKLEFIKLLTQPKKRRRNENKEKHCKVHVHVGQAIGKFSLATIFFRCKKVGLVGDLEGKNRHTKKKKYRKKKQKMLHREFSGMLLVFFNHIEFICQQGISRNYFLSTTSKHHFSFECVSVSVGMFFLLFFTWSAEHTSKR